MFDYEWLGRDAHSSTQSYLCPYCNQLVAGIKEKVIVFHGSSPGGHPTNTDSYYVLKCPACDMPAIYDVCSKTTSPAGKALKDVKHLPESIKKAYDEVSRAIGAQCYTSAVVYARTVIAHIAVDLGADDDLSFVKYVEYLSKNGYTPPNAKDWIDKIRLMGNEATHDLVFWDKDAAETIGKFLMYLLIFIYELPNSI